MKWLKICALYLIWSHISKGRYSKFAKMNQVAFWPPVFVCYFYFLKSYYIIILDTTKKEHMDGKREKSCRSYYIYK